MPVIFDNNFTKDSYGVRSERLNNIQANLSIIQPDLQAPAAVVTWAEDCYDLFMQKWSTAMTEANEKESATLDLEMKLERMNEEYQNARMLAQALYRNDQVHLKDFDFDIEYPIRRGEQAARVEAVLNTHARHVAKGITHLIPAAVITRLTNAMNDFDDAINNQDKERIESEHSTAALVSLFNTDSGILQELRAWWFAMMGKSDARIGYIGMVNPKARHSGHTPDPPELGYSTSGIFFSEVTGATSYQIVYKLDSPSVTDWEEVYSGSFEPDPIPFSPPSGSYLVKGRSRNDNGFGEWGEELHVLLGLQPTTITEGIYNPATHEVSITWLSSPGASSYDVYRSRVTLGDPVGEFTLIEPTVFGLSYQYEATLFGKSEFYYVKVRSGTETSTQSNIMKVDIPNPV